MTATPSIDVCSTEKNSGFLKKDLSAGIVLLLVALPLNLGVALASGVPAEFGIVSGAIGSLITGLISGSPTMVSGPDAGLGVLVLEMINSFGVRYLGPIVLVAGLLQLLVALLRSANWFRAISPAVVNGMLAGMGLLIIVTQFHIMLDDSPKENGLMNLLLIPAAIWKGILSTDGTAPHHMAALVGVITILVIMGWSRFAPKRLKFIPAALVSIVVATGLTALLQLPIQLVTLPAQIGSSLQPPGFGAIVDVLTNHSLLLAAFTLAFVASAQSLITVTATDKISQQQSRTGYDRELLAQGFGNVLCGILGVLPIAGVLVRSAANIQCGAKTRLSNLLHGSLMIACIFLVPGLLQSIPTSALAAVLVLIGCRMVGGILRTVRAYERGELLVFAGTVAAIMLTNLFTGLVIGFAIALARLVYVLLHLDIDLHADSEPGRFILHLHGPATFLHLPRLAAKLESVPPDCELHVRLDEVTYVDHACLELLLTWERKHRDTHGRLVIDWGPLGTILQDSRPTFDHLHPHLSGLRIHPRRSRNKVS